MTKTEERKVIPMTKRNDALDRFVRYSNFAKKTTVIKHPSSKAGGFSPLRQFPQWQEIEAAIKAAPNFPPGEGVEFIFSPEDVAQAGVNFDLAAKRLIREPPKIFKRFERPTA